MAPRTRKPICRICHDRVIGGILLLSQQNNRRSLTPPAMHRTLEFLLHHGYVLLLGWVFVEQLGLPVHSMPLLLAAGALRRYRRPLEFFRLAVLRHASQPWWLISIWYLVGRRKGIKVLQLLWQDFAEPDSWRSAAPRAFFRDPTKIVK